MNPSDPVHRISSAASATAHCFDVVRIAVCDARSWFPTRMRSWTVGLSAALVGTRATILMPQDAPAAKRAAAEGYGLADTMALLFERLKVVVEPSGAIGLAAVLADAERFAGRRVGVVLSGGNVGLDRFAELVARARP